MSDHLLVASDANAATTLAVTTDAVVLTLRDNVLHVLLARLAEQPSRGRLALPGVFVRADEDLDRAAVRAVREKVGIDAMARQFRAFGAVDRDPAMRVISIGYLATLPVEVIAPVLDAERQAFRIEGDRVRAPSGRVQTLPFDHAQIIAAALAHLRFNLDHTRTVFGLLPDEFTLGDLQIAHEAVLGRPLNKPAFRKRLLESGKLVGAARLRTGARARPAELYRVNEEWIDEGR